MLGNELREYGLIVDVLRPHQVHEVSDYDAVIVGGALYMFRWHHAARRFVRRHAHALRQRPVYLFSSGPLDDSAATAEIPPVRGVSKLMTQVGAAGHMTFGGRLSPEARGFPASAMARKQAGDWRDHDQIARWAQLIARQLQGEPVSQDSAQRQS